MAVNNPTQTDISSTSITQETAVLSDVQLAANALRLKAAAYSVFWAYYDGDHPQVYTNKRLAEIFRNIDLSFSENWSAVIIDALDDRVNLQAVRVKGIRAQRKMDDLWGRLSLANESDSIHLAAMVCGESFLIVWPDKDKQADAYFNDPRLCHVFYEPTAPRVKRFACKWWYDGKRMRLTLYYPDRLVYYKAAKNGRKVDAKTKWIKVETAVNSYGVVPVFHFKATQRGKSDLKDVLPIQIGINKLVNDMMVAAEYGAFKQRWIISQTDVLDALKNAPNEIWELPAGDGAGQQTQVGEFQGTDLSAYIRGLDHFSATLAAITRTPKHFFFRTSANVSGEALLTMEAPLTRKATKRINSFTPEWRFALQFLLQLDGAKVKVGDITPLFEPVASLQPLTMANIRQVNTSAGVPLVTQLRGEGWSDDEIAVMEKDRADEIVMTEASAVDEKRLGELAEIIGMLAKAYAAKDAEKAIKYAVG